VVESQLLLVNQRRPFFKLLSARQLEARCGIARDVYIGEVVDHFGGSFRPRKLLGGLGRASQKRGVRIFQNTEAEVVDTGDGFYRIYVHLGQSKSMPVGGIRKWLPERRFLGSHDLINCCIATLAAPSKSPS